MANIMDYLEWRDDVTMRTDPFNEVDNLVLSEISYTNLDGIVPSPESGKKITIQEAARLFFERHDPSELDTDKNGATANAPLFLKKASETRRFGRTKLFAYVNEIDQETEVQFSAVSFILPDHSIYIAFRGTDHTLVGWQEDFNMSYMDATPGQKQAAAYISQIGHFTLRKIHVGGHSKGGNFAVYGAAFADPKVQKKISDVWSNDGPGFNKAIASLEKFKAILPKVHSIVPEHSIIGMIMENAYQHKIVKSNATGLLQHDPTSWQVERNHFREAEKLSDQSLLFDETMRRWLDGIDSETRKEFIAILFQSLAYGGKTTTDEVELSKPKTLSNMMSVIRSYPADKQRLFGWVLAKLAKSWGTTMIDNFKRKWTGQDS
ncbi:MAG: DUF2974 domain-containing protein [Lachnospiraceae bacterium]|nr:DUF2974 domain-containing protein [Lachnospiraceae bacterium]